MGEKRSEVFKALLDAFEAAEECIDGEFSVDFAQSDKQRAVIIQAWRERWADAEDH